MSRFSELRKYFQKAILNGSVRSYLIAFLMIDFLLVATYGLLGLLAVQSGAQVAASFDLGHSKSFASTWNYAKLFFAVCFVLVAAMKTKDRGVAIFLLLPLTLLIDDFFETNR